MAARKNARYFAVLFLVAISLSFSACSASESNVNIDDCYQIRANNDLTYAYEVTDGKGNILLSESAAIREPCIKPVTPSVLEVSTQTGTGLSTNWAIYCDVEAGKVSKKFDFVLGAKDGYVFYVIYENNKHSVICQSIFDPKSYTQEYRMDDPLVNPDSFSKADFETDGVARISYLTGDTAITKEYIIIYFPN